MGWLKTVDEYFLGLNIKISDENGFILYDDYLKNFINLTVSLSFWDASENEEVNYFQILAQIFQNYLFH